MLDNFKQTRPMNYPCMFWYMDIFYGEEKKNFVFD